MIIVTNGIVVYNRAAITEKDGPQNLPPEIEARLVSEGVAEYVNRPVEKSNGKRVATPPEKKKGQGEGDHQPAKEPSSESQRAAQDKPQYSIDMKASELRELLEECGLIYRVGMSKADMVAALDCYFEEETEDNESPPNIGAEDPVI
jgi:hypothetical protein